MIVSTHLHFRIFKLALVRGTSLLRKLCCFNTWVTKNEIEFSLNRIASKPFNKIALPEKPYLLPNFFQPAKNHLNLSSTGLLCSDKSHPPKHNTELIWHYYLIINLLLMVLFSSILLNPP